MTIVRCPRCRDEVTVPKASSQALVRCPLCEEQYILSDALAQIPPALIIVGDATSTPPSIEKLDSGDASDAEDYKLSESGLPPSGFASRPFPGSQLAAAPVLRAASRERKKPKSVIGEAIQVVFGGLLAIPLALLFVWWVAKRDDFDLGPKVAKYVPWIVPARFHGRPPMRRSEPMNAARKAAPATDPSPVQSDVEIVRRAQIEEPVSPEATTTPPPIDPALPDHFPPMPDLLDLLPDNPNP